MTYRLGVDVGTTFTAAAVANGAAPSMLGLGNRALQVPSVLYLAAEGDFLAMLDGRAFAADRRPRAPAGGRNSVLTGDLDGRTASLGRAYRD